MTLNVAHGRKLAKHQALLNRTTIRSNLSDIAAVMRREMPDVIALQEADGPSFWSGGFNHVETIGRLAEIEHYFRGDHVSINSKRTELAYGTAMLSRWPLKGTMSHSFAPSPPTPKKGFVTATVTVPGLKQAIDIVSVHLDFLSKRARMKQIEAMTDALPQPERPRIVLGDMNCAWGGRDDSLRFLADKLCVRPYKPSVRLATYPAKKPRRRIDWIFVSDELEFVRYAALPDQLSDHLGVVAEIKFRGN